LGNAFKTEPSCARSGRLELPRPQAVAPHQRNRSLADGFSKTTHPAGRLSKTTETATINAASAIMPVRQSYDLNTHWCSSAHSETWFLVTDDVMTGGVCRMADDPADEAGFRSD
jgi:hypothetical protein